MSGLRLTVVLTLICVIYGNNNTKEICKGEAFLLPRDAMGVCYRIFHSVGSWHSANSKCCMSSGRLLRVDERHGLLRSISTNQSLSGLYWIEKGDGFFLGDRRTIWRSNLDPLNCVILSFHFDSDSNNTKVDVIIPTSTSSCDQTREMTGFVCAYDIPLPISRERETKNEPQFSVPLWGFIAVSALAFILVIILSACLIHSRCTRSPVAKELYYDKTAPKGPDMYDAPLVSSKLSLKYDTPVEYKDIIEQESLLEEQTTTKVHRLSAIDSFRTAFKSIKTRKKNKKRTECDKEEIEIKKEEEESIGKLNKPTVNEERKDKTPSTSKVVDLAVIEKGKVEKFASLFEGPKLAKENDKTKERDEGIPQDATKDEKVSPSVKQKPVTSPKLVKQGNIAKKPTSSTEKINLDVKKSDSPKILKGKKKTDKESHLYKNEMDLKQKRKIEEELKMVQAEKEIELQRKLSKTAEADDDHEYTYVEDEENVQQEAIDDALYEPMLVYENED